MLSVNQNSKRPVAEKLEIPRLLQGVQPHGHCAPHSKYTIVHGTRGVGQCLRKQMQFK
jgi:hypothetical protein